MVDLGLPLLHVEGAPRFPALQLGDLYSADIDGPVTIGGVTFDLGLNVNVLQAAVNGVYVPDGTILGGRPAISVTLPTGYVDLEAGVSVGGLSATRQVEGFGLGDVIGRLQLGWQHGVSHLVYIQSVAPTGRYDEGFEPNVGLNRSSVDIGWAFIWTEQTSKLQFNGAIGFTFSWSSICGTIRSSTPSATGTAA